MTQLEMHLSEPNSGSTTSLGRLPNFLYIGTSKAASTWIYHVLAAHPEVFMAPAKGAYYFDGHFDYGLDWYREHFRRAGDEAIVGEISHSYLFSREAAERIQQLLPEVKLLACVRNPLERAFSAYLDSVKNGQFSGTFSAALQENPSLQQRGQYATYLEMYLERFPRSQLHVAIFDDLKSDPQGFADDLFEFLSLPGYELKPAMRQKMMPAARPRSPWLAQLAKRIARSCERVGWRSIRGRAKRSRLVRNVLYRPLATDELPSIDDDVRNELKDFFRPEIQRLDVLLGTSLSTRWELE